MRPPEEPTEPSTDESPAATDGEPAGPESSYVLTTILVLILVATLGGVGYAALATSPDTEPFTEFYVVGETGEAAAYPSTLSVGETAEITVGITNHEGQELTYTLVMAADGERLDEQTLTVDDGETVEEPITFFGDEPGEKRLEILLFREPPGETLDEPYRDLRLVIEIEE